MDTFLDIATFAVVYFFIKDLCLSAIKIAQLFIDIKLKK